MPSSLSVLRGPYLSDLLAQPKALGDTLASLRTLAALPASALGRPRMILTGMGSSLHAFHPLQIQLAREGRAAMMIETAELVHAQSELVDDQTLVIAASQSGRSAETTSLLKLIRRRANRPFVIGITNTADSQLALQADYTVMLRAGTEFSVSCKTYLATLLAMEWLGAALLESSTDELLDELTPSPTLVEAYLASWEDHVQQLTSEVQSIRHLFLTGRGSSLATVNTGALILKESTRFHAEGMSSPAFRHGPLEMVNPNLFALVFAGEAATSGLNRALVNDVIAAGGRAELVGEDASHPVFRLPRASERSRPMMEMLPVQMLSLALASLAGREPGVFERASKVTDTE